MPDDGTAQPPVTVELPSPSDVRELVGVLKTASQDVIAAREKLQADFAQRARKLEGVAQVAADTLQETLERSTDDAQARLTQLSHEATELSTKLRAALKTLKSSSDRLDVGLGTLSRVVEHARTERETWDAQARSRDARYEAAIQELRAELSKERYRIIALEAETLRLKNQQQALEGRLSALEKKKVFGLF